MHCRLTFNALARHVDCLCCVNPVIAVSTKTSHWAKAKALTRLGALACWEHMLADSSMRGLNGRLLCLLSDCPTQGNQHDRVDGPSHIAVVAYALLAWCGAYARGAGGACMGSCWHQHLQQCKASLALGALGANAQAKVWLHSLCMTARR